jgi:hypothetical protein
VHNDRDTGNISNYEKANAHFLSKCQQVAVLFKSAVAQHIRMLFQGTHNEAFRVGNRANLEILRAELIRRYGGWTDAKGQRNFKAAEALGYIVDVDSSDNIFHKFQMLINERTNWENEEEMFRPSYYRSWLIKRISKWDLLAATHIAMKLSINMTYVQGKEQVVLLVEQERIELALGNLVSKLVVKPVAQPVIEHDFSMSSNNVTLTRDEYEAMVAAAAQTASTPYTAKRSSTNPRNGVCFRCGQAGHQIKDCPRQQPLRKPTFIRPTSEQNETFQAYLRNQQARQSGQQAQFNSRKRTANETDASGAPAWKKPQWPPKGTKPIVAVSVESDADQFEEFIGAAGVVEADGDVDFDPEVYRPEEGYSE